jgi:hypothetical protein
MLPPAEGLVDPPVVELLALPSVPPLPELDGRPPVLSAA